MIERVNYNVKKISNGYLISYWFQGEDVERSFENWKDALKFLQENPPKVYDILPANDNLIMEIE